MVAFVNRFDRSLVHRFVPMVPEERRLALAPPRHRRGGGIGAWSRDEVASEISRLGEKGREFGERELGKLGEFREGESGGSGKGREGWEKED
eukprot:scaffold264778_cov30-Attheya_sp.AAC.1